MSKQQRETVDQMLRQGSLDFGGEVDEQRRLFADLLSAVPVPGDVRIEEASVPVTLEVTPDVPHVFVGFAGMLDEADEALTKAGQFIRANLDSTRN